MALQEEYKKYKKEIKLRLKEFSNLARKKYIKELFFCILTPQSNAEKCWQAVQELEKCEFQESSIQNCLRTKTRFHNNKARYLVEANKKWRKIEKLINSNNPQQVRELLIKNVRGIGLKEASHFLRNIGKSKNQLAILDRHVLEQLKKSGVIGNIKLTNSNYLEIEEKMKKFSNEIKIPLDELDLLFWKLESGRIFK